MLKVWAPAPHLVPRAVAVALLLATSGAWTFGAQRLAWADEGARVEVETASPKPPTSEGTRVEIVAPDVSVRALIAQGKLDEALQLLEQQLAVNPADDELRVQHARVLYWKGQLAKALAEAEGVLARHPSDMELLELAAQIWLAMGDIAKSIEYYMALQTVGDNRPEIQQRVIDLLLQIEDVLGVEAALARGGKLGDEQQLALARILHPWSIDGGSAVTLYNEQVWPRLDFGLGRRLNRHATVTTGVLAEQRGSGTTTRTAWSPRLELYTAAGRFGGMFHLSGSPSEAFLPGIDARADLNVSLHQIFALGLWLRYAYYMPAGVAHVGALTIAPNLSFHAGNWTITPGYVAVLLAGQVANSGMLKLRYQSTPSNALFAWMYLGADPNFIDRQSAKPSLGVTGLLGLDHWFTPRFGLRASVARIQPFGAFNAFTEFALGVRGRL